MSKSPQLSTVVGNICRYLGLSTKPIEAVSLALPLLKRFEGIHDDNPDTPILEPTADPAGYLTAGYGRLLMHPSGRRLIDTKADRRFAQQMYPDGITMQDAEMMLVSDTIDVYRQLTQLIGFEALNAGQQAALVSFAYNLGVHNLKSSTLWEMVTAGQMEYAEIDPAQLYKQATLKLPITQIDEAFTAWCRYKDQLSGRMVVSKGLFIRRLAELMVFDGRSPDNAIEIADIVGDNL